MFSLTSLTKNLFLRSPTMIESVTATFQTTAVLERARKGTRVRKRKVALANRKKKEEKLRKNPPPIPYKVQLMLASKGLTGPPQLLRGNDNEKSFPMDDVYFINEYAYKRYTLEEAIENWRQLCGPTMYDDHNSLIHIKIEFDMRASKKDRYVEGFTKMVPIIKPYERNIPDRVVLCFVPTEEMRLEALQNGAVMAGGADLISDVQKGRVDLAEIDNFLAHEDLLKECKSLAPVLRDKAPSVASGTIGSDIVRLIQTFSKGMHLQVEKVKPSLGVADEPDYAFCKATIGRLDMEVEDLNENLTVMLENLNQNKPKRKDGSGFITRVQVFCKPNEKDNLSQHLNFSIIHPLIYDNRVEEQEKVLQENRAVIAENVNKLRQKP